MDFTHQLVAHRGWQNRFPENTLAGIEAAINAGARHIEIDIQLTADYVPMLCHDQSLLRSSGINKNINKLDYSELKEVSAYEPERLGDTFKGTPLSSLSECVALIEQSNDVTLYVEVKRQSLRHFGIDSVLQATLPLLGSIRGRCFLISFDIPVLQAARNAGWPQIAPVLRNLRQLDSDAIKTLAPEMVFCDSKLLSRKNALENLAYPVAVYEIDQYDTALQWLNRGATLVETFCIGELIAAHNDSSK